MRAFVFLGVWARIRHVMLLRCGRISFLAILLVGLLAAFGSAGPSDGRPLAATGTLAFRAEFAVRYPSTACPPGTPGSIECYGRTGSETVRGLGEVKESWPYRVNGSPVGCAPDEVRVLPATVRFSVAGKGEIELQVDGSGCLARIPPAPVQGAERFTVTGGSGRYAAASGGGTITHVSGGPPAFNGTDTWTGTLVVTGVEFDLTGPVLTVPRNRTVRAPRRANRVRVKYAVSARDEVDGAIPALCRPKSGSWFAIGRARVRCSAADVSGNASTASFIVAVKRAR
jgi:HYR domain